MFLRNLNNKIPFSLATGLGSGFLPAPGTAGSVVALLIWFFSWQYLPLWGQIAIVLLSMLVGVTIITHATLQLKQHDSKHIVWDEFIGMWVTLLFIPNDTNLFYSLSLAFAFFRFFDIVKPFPISWIDRKITNSWGIIFDDVVAGLFAGICVLIANSFVL